MEENDHARKSRIVNIKENFHIYSYKRKNMQIDDHTADDGDDDEDNNNIPFDAAIAYTDTLS
jgi:hypothetical protein